MFSKCCNEPIIDGLCMGCGETSEVLEEDNEDLYKEDQE